MKRSHEIDFSEGRLLPKLIAFSIPVMLSGILQLAFNAADLIVVGRFEGEVALAAVGSNGALVSLVVNVFMGLGSGISVLAARYFGAKDDRRLGETVETAAIVGVLGGVLTALVGLLLSVPMLRVMSTPENVLPWRRYICAFISWGSRSWRFTTFSAPCSAAWGIPVAPCCIWRRPA